MKALAIASGILCVLGFGGVMLLPASVGLLPFQLSIASASLGCVGLVWYGKSTQNK